MARYILDWLAGSVTISAVSGHPSVLKVIPAYLRTGPTYNEVYADGI